MSNWFRLQNQAKEHSERVDAESESGLSERQERQREINAAAQGDAAPGMGGAPATSSAAAAPALSPRLLLSKVMGWGRGTQKDAPTKPEIRYSEPQSRTHAPEPFVDDEEEDPGLEGTPAQDSTLSRQTIELRSQLGWHIRGNLQKLDRKRC